MNNENETNSKYQTYDLPQKIKNEITNNNLAIFIGAGVSRIVGCKGWDELSNNLLKECWDKKCINYTEYELLKQEKDNKKIISICQDIMKSKQLEESFWIIFKEALSSNESSQEHEIYNLLFNLGSLFITTNADTEFHYKFLQCDIIYQNFENEIKSLDNRKLYQIHGCIKNRESLIFTLPKYLERYSDKGFISLMKKLFAKNSILFVGYGLAEFEILDFLIVKSGISEGSSANDKLKHHILLPIFSYEESVFEYYKNYYKSLGIEAIRYNKDVNSYLELINVLKEWNKDVTLSPIIMSDNLLKVKNTLSQEFPIVKGDINFLVSFIKVDKMNYTFFFANLAIVEYPHLELLQPLFDKEYFSPLSLNSEMTDDSKENIERWDILIYLRNTATYLQKNPEVESIDLVEKIARDIARFLSEENCLVKNSWINWCIISIIFKLPIERINIEDIQLIKTLLNSEYASYLISDEIDKEIIPLLIFNNKSEMLLELIDIVTDYNITSTSIIGIELKPIFDDYWLAEVLKEYYKDISRICSIDVFNICIGKISAILTEDPFQFNIYSIPKITSMNDSSQNQEYDSLIVSFACSVLDNLTLSLRKDAVNDLLSKKETIFIRIALYMINKHYAELKDLFWDLEHNPLEVPYVDQEVYEILHQNASNILDKELDIFIPWVNAINPDFPVGYEESKKERALAYHQKQWVFALMENPSSRIKELYDKFNSICPDEIENPEFRNLGSYLTVPKSPYEIEELGTKSVEEIAKILIEFEPEERFDSPSKNGLAVELRQLIYANPLKYKDLSPLLNVDNYYLYFILWGFLNYLKDQHKLDWEGILTFMENLVLSDDFWAQVYKKEDIDHREWVTSTIAELINAGTIRIETCFEYNYYERVKTLMFMLEEKMELESYERKEILDKALNSNASKIFTAFINLNRRYTSENKVNGIKWDPEIKDKIFNGYLKSSDSKPLEFYTILGIYLVDFWVLDKDWVTSNLSLIFPWKEKHYWEASFTGYLYNASYWYLDIYTVLKENNHYQHALTYQFANENINDRLSQHIGIAYLKGIEKLKDRKSLISRLIHSDAPDLLRPLIKFFWRSKESVKPENKIKIKLLWKKLHKELSKKDSEAFEQVAASLVNWLSIVDKIDKEILALLKYSIKFLKNRHTTYLFVNSLIPHLKETPKPVGELLYALLNEEFCRFSEKEKITEIVDTLFKKDSELALRICIKYQEYGHTFLDNVLEKNRKYLSNANPKKSKPKN